VSRLIWTTYCDHSLGWIVGLLFTDVANQPNIQWPISVIRKKPSVTQP
jgi:hypothetical protein